MSHTYEQLLDPADFERARDKKYAPSLRLLKAAADGDEVSVLLFKDSYDTAMRAKSGLTPLMLAIYKHEGRCAGMLASEAAAKEVDSKGNTALMWAARRGDESSVDALIPISDPSRQSNSGMSALMWASLTNQQVFEKLLPHSDPNQTCDLGRTAAHWACNSGFDSNAEKLAGLCDIKQKDNKGMTPLMVAAACPETRSDTSRCVEMLLSKVEAEHVQEADLCGRTALHHAAMGGNCETIQLLLPLSDTRAVDHTGKTALACALAEGQHRAAGKIREYVEMKEERAALLEAAGRPQAESQNSRRALRI
jgi:ankyrin repeat protein